MTPMFFETAAAFRRWLAKNHDKVKELIVGFHKLDSGLKSITYPEALDEALCIGWIDGVRKSISPTSYTVRFTPRKAKSYWSAVNLRHFERLRRENRVTPMGLAVFEARDRKTTKYSYENKPQAFHPAYEKTFRKNAKAWENFTKSAPSFQRVAIFWVMSAKQEETRKRRLKTLIEHSERGHKPKQFISPKGKT